MLQLALKTSGPLPHLSPLTSSKGTHGKSVLTTKSIASNPALLERVSRFGKCYPVRRQAAVRLPCGGCCRTIPVKMRLDQAGKAETRASAGETRRRCGPTSASPTTGCHELIVTCAKWGVALGVVITRFDGQSGAVQFAISSAPHPRLHALPDLRLPDRGRSDRQSEGMVNQSEKPLVVITPWAGQREAACLVDPTRPSSGVLWLREIPDISSESAADARSTWPTGPPPPLHDVNMIDPFIWPAARRSSTQPRREAFPNFRDPERINGSPTALHGNGRERAGSGIVNDASRRPGPNRRFFRYSSAFRGRPTKPRCSASNA